MRRWALRSVSAALVIAFVMAVWQTTLRQGWTARYYAGEELSGPPRLRVVEDGLGERLNTRIARLFAGDPFAATFDAFLEVDHDGDYVFELRSNETVALWVNGAHTLERRRGAGRNERRARVPLTEGVHALHIRYHDRGGAPSLRLSWGPDSGDRLTDVPAERLFVSRIGSYVRPWLPPQGVLLPLLLSGFILLGAAMVLTRHVTSHLRDHPTEHGLNRALCLLLAGSTLLTTVGIWWGLPEFRGWALDEVIPADVLGALRNGVEEGWLLRYPPLHFYLLGAVLLPFELLARVGIADPWTAESYLAAYVLIRAVSVLMAIGTVYVVYLCATEVFRDRAAGVWSGLLVATMPVLVFYGKTANLDVPYLFWFALSLLFYGRYLRNGLTGSLVAFAAVGTMAICTKDQAYGFYLFPAVHLVWLRFRASLGLAVFRDRPLQLAVLTTAVVFILGEHLLFAPGWFVEHVRFATGPGSEGFAVYPPAVSGYVQMLVDSATQLGWMLSWPGLVVSVIAVGLALRRWETSVIWLLLPALSYYVCFIAVVRYQYDRFLLGIGLILALFGGRLLAELVTRAPRRWATVGGGVVVGYMILYGAAVDAVMLGDGRYQVEQWVQTHVDPTARVAMAGASQLMPRIPDATTFTLREHWPEVERLQPEYIMIDTARLCRFEPGSSPARFYAQLRSGQSPYTRVLESRRRVALARLAPGIYHRPCGNNLTNLSKIDPTIELYRRRQSTDD